MGSTTEVSGITKPFWDLPRRGVNVRMEIEPRPAAEVVSALGSIQGPVDVYCWYEGDSGLLVRGAKYMRDEVFQPLYELKRDAKLWVYMLNAWSFQAPVNKMNPSVFETPINRINNEVLRSLSSAEFFRYCAQIPVGSDLYNFVNQELPKKEYLIRLSKDRKDKDLTVGQLFNNKASLMDCSRNMDVQKAYSQLQYIEGYFLVQEAIKRGLEQKQSRVEVAFVLANDESKYYADFEKDIETMLRLDFGASLDNMEINITFLFFKYGDKMESRPYTYIPKDVRVKKPDITSYFTYLQQPNLRDVIHNLNV